jgi:hypothetical protein
VPLRFGKEETIKEQIGIPEIKFEGGGTGVSVGSVYSQEVTFKSLKPTIVGTGLQAADFGWSISGGDMLDMSAKRLIAIVGVPKGASQLELQMVVTMKAKGPLLGFLQGDVATAELKSLKLDLH